MSHWLDDAARGLAEGRYSRRRVLRRAGGVAVGVLLGSVGVPWVRERRHPVRLHRLRDSADGKHRIVLRRTSASLLREGPMTIPAADRIASTRDEQCCGDDDGRVATTHECCRGTGGCCKQPDEDEEGDA